jgi:hypothetical protein
MVASTAQPQLVAWSLSRAVVAAFRSDRLSRFGFACGFELVKWNSHVGGPRVSNLFGGRGVFSACTTPTFTQIRNGQ